MACNCKKDTPDPRDLPKPNDPRDYPKPREAMHCFCGLTRLLPEGMKMGDEFTLVPCPRCGSPFKGRVTVGGVVEILE